MEGGGYGRAVVVMGVVVRGLLQGFKSRQEILREAFPFKSPVIRLLTALYLGIKGRRREGDVDCGRRGGSVKVKHQQLLLYCPVLLFYGNYGAFVLPHIHAFTRK